MKHRLALEHAQASLVDMEASFRAGDGAYERHFNDFLTSAQGVIYALNKSFLRERGYAQWMAGRGSRLPPDGLVFKGLRTVSFHEGPVENAGVTISWRLPDGEVLEPFAEVTTSWINTQTGAPTSRDVTVRNKDGTAKIYKDTLGHDFIVEVESSDGKVYRLDSVITQARSFLAGLQAEVDEAERRFKR